MKTFFHAAAVTLSIAAMPFVWFGNFDVSNNLMVTAILMMLLLSREP
jgi:hypothetical protein